MGCNETLISLVKNTTYDNVVSISDNILTTNFKKNIETIVEFCVLGFIEIDAIKIDATIGVCTSVSITQSKSTKMDSLLKIDTVANGATTRLINIANSIVKNSHVSMSLEEKMALESLISLTDKKKGNLGLLDLKTLKTLDALSLEYLDYKTTGELQKKELLEIDAKTLSSIDGNELSNEDFNDPYAISFDRIYATCAKKSEVISNVKISTVMDLKLYTVFKLSYYDGNALSAIDDDTFGELDRIEI